MHYLSPQVLAASARAASALACAVVLSAPASRGGAVAIWLLRRIQSVEQRPGSSTAATAKSDMWFELRGFAVVTPQRLREGPLPGLRITP
jgi:hypothetical protein